MILLLAFTIGACFSALILFGVLRAGKLPEHECGTCEFLSKSVCNCDDSSDSATGLIVVFDNGIFKSVSFDRGSIDAAIDAVHEFAVSEESRAFNATHAALIEHFINKTQGGSRC